MQRWEEVQISNFSGPLDLLLNLVREKKLNVLELNLIELTHQYLDYLNHQQELDIEIASEYLLMAATLIEMKSRLLIPQETLVSDQNDYSYEDFVEQLSRYEQFRTVSDFFTRAQEDYFTTRSPKKSQRKYQFDFAQSSQELDADEFLSFNLETLSKVYARVAQKYQKNVLTFNDEDIDIDEEEYHLIETNLLSPRQVSDLILEKMQTRRLEEWSMFDLLSFEMINLTNLISVFLATLDLVKYQIVSVRQNQEQTDLYLRFTKYALENPDQLNGLEVENYE
ncbi:segregation and condensation protein A [Mesoplasma whartonense]|uniref:segregation and condensation protein A n=1 Tax=Mesoplasma whartonense TaxID=2878854 RepID=UPI002022A606|nr:MULTISPECIES: segregation/condensation protein A [unclassified Mesoplasma]MCL8212592.1 Segregation and condensation protein A [Mesoplasma sp. JKS002661]MCL8216014.1 Segregation and condensation protein A [Mesoplasma sp. JKS002657]